MDKSNSIDKLPKPAIYFPIIDGHYSTRAGLSRFGDDIGNGKQDAQLFQFDNTYTLYRNNKLAIRDQSIDHYVCTDTTSLEVLKETGKWLLQHLCKEHPDKFLLQHAAQSMQLSCHLTSDKIFINNDGSLNSQNISYKNLFDALALQVQEDICVMQKDGDRMKMVAAHLCAANHWSAREKLLMDMSDLHQHVPGFTDNNPEPDKLLLGLQKKIHPYTRFAWGLCKHATLNQHPEQPPKQDSNSGLFMRVERQAIWPMVNTETLLFTIRTYFYDCAELDTQQCRSLINAVNSMSDATLRYKNINRTNVVNKLLTLLDG